VDIQLYHIKNSTPPITSHNQRLGERSRNTKYLFFDKLTHELVGEFESESVDLDQGALLQTLAGRGRERGSEGGKCKIY